MQIVGIQAPAGVYPGCEAARRSPKCTERPAAAYARLASLRDPVAQLVTSVATIGLIGGIIAPFGAAWLLIKKVPGVSQTL